MTPAVLSLSSSSSMRSRSFLTFLPSDPASCLALATLLVASTSALLSLLSSFSFFFRKSCSSSFKSVSFWSKSRSRSFNFVTISCLSWTFVRPVLGFGRGSRVDLAADPRRVLISSVEVLVSPFKSLIIAETVSSVSSSESNALVTPNNIKATVRNFMALTTCNFLGLLEVG